LGLGALFSTLPIFAQSPITVSGTTQFSNGSNCAGGVGGTNCFVRVRLRNFNGFVPRVLGLGTIVATQIPDIYPSNVGAWSTNLWGNDQISPNTCGATLNLACTFYTFEFWYGGKMVSSANWQFIGIGPFNLNTQLPIQSPPNPPPPAYMPSVDRKSTRLNSSHVAIAYAVFCMER